MQYTSTFTFPSQYDPSITIVIKKPSYGDRIALDAKTEAYRARVRKIAKRSQELDRITAPQERAFNSQKTAKLRDLKKTLATAREEEQPELEAEIAEVEASFYEEPFDVQSEKHELGQESLRAIATDYNPTLVRWGLVEIQGLQINGQAAGVEELLSSGPQHLVYEIVQAIEQAMGLSGEELKNSSLPSISSAVEDGKTSDTTAPDVETQDSTTPETVDFPKPENSTPATA